jgi:hypothetical protein
LVPILYVETNFAIAIAKGQDLLAARLVADRFAGIQAVIPGACLMEAFSVLEEERKGRNRFHDQLKQQAHEAKRDRSSSHARGLMKHLEQALVESGELLNEIEGRLFNALGMLSECAEFIGLEHEVIEDCLASNRLSTPTDNLILCSILWHARRHPREPKAFFSRNSHDFGQPGVLQTLLDADVVYFDYLGNALKWLQAPPTSPSEPHGASGPGE